MDIVRVQRAKPPRPRMRRIESAADEEALIWAADVLLQYAQVIGAELVALHQEREAAGEASMSLGPERGG